MEKLLALAISLVPNLSPNEQKRLAQKCGGYDFFSRLEGSALYDLGLNIKQNEARNKKWSVFNGKKTLEEAERLLNQLERRNISVMHIFDYEYPPLLREIYGPPFLLYYRGSLPNPNKPALAIVGTRRPSLKAKQETALFTREAALSVSSIVSGLALGIDGQAHRAAIAEKAHTTAVLGGGFDHLYPLAHKGLAAQIIDAGGLLLSEYPPSSTPTRYNFPERNRIVSGLARGVLVVDAPLKSGALITASLALEQGRDLFVHACGLDQADSGVSMLQEQGAVALRRGEDLLALWNLKQAPKKKEAKLHYLNEEAQAKPEKVYNIGKSIAQELWNEIGDEEL